MNHQATSRIRLAGSLGAGGGAAAIVGIYFVPWFSMTAWNGHSYGGLTLYKLQTFVSGGWYSYASQVMVLGAIILLASGSVAIFKSESRLSDLLCAGGLTIGSVVVVGASLRTGLPHWFTMEPLYLARGVGEWFCLVGAIFGIAGCAVALRAALNSNAPGVELDDEASMTPVA